VTVGNARVVVDDFLDVDQLLLAGCSVQICASSVSRFFGDRASNMTDR
jgi:hypothetical protein